MLHARKASVWKKRYDISVDGDPIVTWDPAAWLSGGTLIVEGRPYRVRVSVLGATYTMEGDDGTVVAIAKRVGRRKWTIETPDGGVYEFHRISFWGTEQELMSGGQRLGSVKKVGFWRSGATADLPGIPLPLQVFTLAVILSMWARNASAAAGGASAAAAGGAASS